MTNNNNTTQLPPLPEDDATLFNKISRYLLDMSVEYGEPQNLLEYQGVAFSALGGIQAISGQKKNGKTWVLTQLMAAILGDDSERVAACLPGLRLQPETKEKLGKEPSVLYVDTEMEERYTVKVARRVHWLCGWDMSKNYDRFRKLWLRTVEDPAEKIDIITSAIKVLKPTAVFIDGVRDLVKDFNDIQESMPLILKLMKIATEQNCCIWNVLHMNPRPGNDDESKMRGHLGTELGNKVTDTFASYKKKDTDGNVTFTVKQLDARGKDVPDWSFKITDDAGALGIPRIINAPTGETAEKVKKDDPENIRLWLTEGQRDIEWPATGQEIKTIFRNRGGVTNAAQQQADLMIARNRRFILQQSKTEMAPGQNFPKFILNDTEILPF